MLQKLLELQDIKAYSAANGQEGITLIDEEKPQAAIIDIGLPDIDGYAIAELIRQRGDSEILLVALTGYGQPADIARAKDAGFDHHLVKPLVEGKLAQCLGLE